MYGKIAAFENISCWCDRLVTSYSDGGTCYFLSLFGREAEVTSVMGSFIENRECRVEGFSSSPLWIGRDNQDNYRILTRKTGNVLHKIAFGQEAFQGDRYRIIIANSPEEAKDKVIRFLDSGVSTPINMAWKDHVFTWMQDSNGIGYAYPFGFDESTIAYQVDLPSEERLEDYILNELLPQVTTQS